MDRPNLAETVSVPQSLDLIGDFGLGEAGSLRETVVGLVAHDLDQGGRFSGAGRPDCAEFRKMGAQR